MAERGLIIVLGGFAGTKIDRLQKNAVLRFKQSVQYWPPGVQSPTPPAFRSLAIILNPYPELELDDPGTGPYLEGVELVLNGLLQQEPRGGEVTGYGYLINALKRLNYRVFPLGLDWRVSVASNAALLASLIAANRTGLPVTIFAHSMGGLVARYAWSLLNDAGKAKVNRIITLGTPHYGSVATVKGFFRIDGFYQTLIRVGGHSSDLDRAITSFPSFYELLPNPAATFGWPGDLSGTEYDSENEAARRGYVSKVHLPGTPGFHGNVSLTRAQVLAPPSVPASAFLVFENWPTATSHNLIRDLANREARIRSRLASATTVLAKLADASTWPPGNKMVSIVGTGVSTVMGLSALDLGANPSAYYTGDGDGRVDVRSAGPTGYWRYDIKGEHNHLPYVLAKMVDLENLITVDINGPPGFAGLIANNTTIPTMPAKPTPPPLEQRAPFQVPAIAPTSPPAIVPSTRSDRWRRAG